jgi:hypothetical protein
MKKIRLVSLFFDFTLLVPNFSHTAVVIMGLLPIAAQAAKTESIYTSLDLSKECKRISYEVLSSNYKIEDNNGYSDDDFYECPGVSPFRLLVEWSADFSWPIIVSNGNKGTSLQRYIRDNRPAKFPFLSSTHVEWRVKSDRKGNKKPYALIFGVKGLTYFEYSDSPFFEALYVAKVSGKEICVIGHVFATGNPRAHIEAREMADRLAKSARCQ